MGGEVSALLALASEDDLAEHMRPSERVQHQTTFELETQSVKKEEGSTHGFGLQTLESRISPEGG